MKVLIIVACLTAAVMGGSFMESTLDKFSKWSKFKAIESCIGEEVTFSSQFIDIDKTKFRLINVALQSKAYL